MDKMFSKITEFFQPVRTPALPLPAGMYHFQSPPEAPTQYRLHLRMEPDGKGLLIVNARTTLHLNKSAAEFAYYLVHDASMKTILDQMSDRYNVKRDVLQGDYQQFLDTIESMAKTEDLDPETFFAIDRTDPYSEEISAPYRLDCALTYRQNENITPGVVPTERVRRELLTEEWHQILQKSWDAGIPHVIFTGGEPTIRPDLTDLIAFSEKLGQVTGLLTDGYRLCDPDYLHSLLNAGIDHLMILLDPKEDQSWEAVLDSLKEDVFVTVHLTVGSDHLESQIETIDRLAGMGVKSFSLTEKSVEYSPVLKKCAEYAASKSVSLVWDIPVPYSIHNPVAKEMEGEAVINGAGKAWLYIEPDGDVLPAQGINQPLGNLLLSPWETVWNNPSRTSLK